MSVVENHDDKLTPLLLFSKSIFHLVGCICSVKPSHSSVVLCWFFGSEKTPLVRGFFMVPRARIELATRGPSEELFPDRGAEGQD